MLGKEEKREKEDELGFPRKKISQRSWRRGLQNVPLPTQSTSTVHVMLTQHLCVTFQAMATLHPVSVHLQRGLGSGGLLVWQAYIGRLDIFEVNPRDFMTLDLGSEIWAEKRGQVYLSNVTTEKGEKGRTRQRAQVQPSHYDQPEIFQNDFESHALFGYVRASPSIKKVN